MPGDKGEKTKHDRCVEGVKRNSPNAFNPHAICVAQGVKPEKWTKKSENNEEVTYNERGQWSIKKTEKFDFDKDGKLDEHEKHHKKLDDKHKKDKNNG